MPIYEYQCEHCGESTEMLQKISDKPARLCPHCNKEGLIKRISAAAFHLKGGGWYVTDFKDKPKEADKKTTEKPEKFDLTKRF